MLTDPDLKDCVSNITRDTKEEDWSKIDSSKGRVVACVHTLVTKFIDDEVVVTLTKEWTPPFTGENVDKRTKEGVFENCGHFNPNNLVI